jgi:hypothetical protein
MEREEIEYLTALIDITVTNTLTKLDLIPERYSESKANEIYGTKQIKRWREKKWIVAYPSGNATNAKYYYLRSECETARLMMESILRKGYDGKITKTMEGTSIRRILDMVRKEVFESIEIKAVGEKEKAKDVASKLKARRNKA